MSPNPTSKNLWLPIIILMVAGSVVSCTQTPTAQNQARDGSPKDIVVMGYMFSINPQEFTQYDFSNVTHLVLAFYGPKPDGSIEDVENVDEYLAHGIVDYCHKLGTKVYLSVGGARDSDNFHKLTPNAAARQAFAKNVAEFLTKHNLDGVDIDYEFPENDKEKDDLTKLMQELNIAVKKQDPKDEVMFCVTAGSRIGYYDWPELAKCTDYAFYMGYNWSMPANGPMTSSDQYTTNAGFDIEASCRGAMEYMMNAGYPAAKIVFGMPFYPWGRQRRDYWAQNREELKLHPEYLEVPIERNGRISWVNTPEALQAKMTATLDPEQTVLTGPNGKATVAGVGFWSYRSDQLPEQDLTRALKSWITDNIK